MATLGPDSFVTDPGQTPLSPGSGFDAGLNSSSQIGGGTSGVNVDARGAISNIQGNLAAIDAITKFAGAALQPKIDKMQQELMWKGVERAAAGESMEDIRSSTGFISRFLGESQLIKGAAAYRGSAAVADIATELSNEEENVQLDPAAFRQKLIERVNAQRIGDPDVDAIIEAQGMQIMPAVFTEQGIKREKKLREDRERERFNADTSMAKRVKEIFTSVARGDLPPETMDAAQTMYANSVLTRGDDENDASYVRRIQALAGDAVSTGNLAVFEMIRRTGAVDLLPPEVQSGMRGLEEKAFDVAKVDFARQNPEMIRMYHQMEDNAQTPQDYGNIARLYNYNVQMFAGATPNGELNHLQAADPVASERKSQLEYMRLRQEDIKFRNKVQTDMLLSNMDNQARIYLENGDHERAAELGMQARMMQLESGGEITELPKALADAYTQRRIREEGIEERLQKEAAASEKLARQNEKALAQASALSAGSQSVAAGGDLNVIADEENTIKDQVLFDALESAGDDVNKRAEYMVNITVGSDRTAYPYVSERLKTQLARPFQQNQGSPVDVARAIQQYEAILAQPMGALAVEKLYGTDLVDKIDQFRTMPLDDSNIADWSKNFREVFGGPSLARRMPVPTKDSLAIGQEFAEDNAQFWSGLRAGRTQRLTSNHVKSEMARDYASSYEQFRSRYPMKSDAEIRQLADKDFAMRGHLIGGTEYIRFPNSHLDNKNLSSVIQEIDPSLGYSPEHLADALKDLVKEKTDGKGVHEGSWVDIGGFNALSETGGPIDVHMNRGVQRNYEMMYEPGAGKHVIYMRIKVDTQSGEQIRTFTGTVDELVEKIRVRQNPDGIGVNRTGGGI